MQSTSDMQIALSKVADIAKEIKELSGSLEETLKNRDLSLEDTSEGIRNLIKDSGSTFISIIEKSRTAQETLKTKTKSNESPLLSLGTRVNVGPDSDFEDKFIRTGTVVGHNENDRAHYKWPTGDRKTVDVIWDHNNRRDKYHCNRPCEVMTWAGNENTMDGIKRGCKVKRGRGWKKEKGDEDGGIDSIGIVFKLNKSRDFTDVYVCWSENKNIGLYRFEDEVVFADSPVGQEEEARSDDYQGDIEYEPEIKPKSTNDSNLPTLKRSNPSGKHEYMLR
ncbi:uncharacterized protein [Argopecten irradians]|uniref:uncharacterized protein isoform X2 n=1 Tax=Argopecten irradians TaxID=31199 RepID=UPI003714CE99